MKKILIWLLILTAIADLGTTAYAWNLEIFHETNPLYLSTGSMVGPVIIKFLYVALLVWCLMKYNSLGIHVRYATVLVCVLFIFFQGYASYSNYNKTQMQPGTPEYEFLSQEFTTEYKLESNRNVITRPFYIAFFSLLLTFSLFVVCEGNTRKRGRGVYHESYINKDMYD